MTTDHELDQLRERLDKHRKAVEALEADTADLTARLDAMEHQ